jgi:hypothetical protein
LGATIPLNRKHCPNQQETLHSKPSGGSLPPLEQHEDFILDLIKEQPDMTLDEIVAAMKNAKIAGSRKPKTAVDRLRIGR